VTAGHERKDAGEVIGFRHHFMSTERVLNGLPAHAYGIWHPIDPGLHRVEDPFVFPARDPLLACPAYTWA
jgi:hypothetical protein